MSYEKTAIADTASAIPSAAQPQMREERVVEPYNTASRLSKAQEIRAKLSQPNSSVTSDSSAEPKSATEETVTLSPAAAALARKEAKHRQQEQAFKAEKLALEAERAEIAELKALKAKLAAKDYSGVESLLSYDEYTNYLIDKGSASTPEQQELKTLKSELEGVKKAQQDDVSKRFEEAVNQRRKAVTELVEKDESYSSIKELKMQEAVVQHILDTWEHDNIDLTPEQAAKEVEELLIERANEEYAKLSGLSKIKSKSAVVDEKKQLPPLKQGIKTLTNNMTATGEIKRPAKSFQGMTDNERWAEARRRAEEKLK